MDFMGFHIVDIVIVALVLFLAIKGLVNGFGKELINFFIIVGGIALAARFHTTVIELINTQNIVPTIPESYAKIIGFVVILVSVWLILGVVSSIITKLTANTTGAISRLFGYVLSAARYMFIFSLIVFGVNQSDFFKNEASKLKTETKLFIPMTEIGARLLNIDLNTSTATINEETNTTEEMNISDTAVDLNLTMTPTTLVEHNTSN